MSFFDVAPMFAADYYKVGHAIKMQPKSASMVYSTWTARSYKHHPNCPKTVVFGHQYTIQKLLEFWQTEFFDQSVELLEQEWNHVIKSTFHPDYADFTKFKELHKLGYLPISIMGVPEGTLLPVGIPDHVIFSNHQNFAWLPQFIEDQWSANNWLPSTSATTAFYRRKLIEPYVKTSCDDMSALPHMCGDFSLRGHTSLEAGYISGAAHALSFDRTATIGSNLLLEKYYGADLENNPPMMGTPSLEHSVVEQGVAWMKQKITNGDLTETERYLFSKAAFDNWDINLIAEMLFINYLCTEVQPTGTMTYVSDTYDYWGIVSKVLPMLHDVIAARDGCFSVRPDSGDPVKIICGDPDAVPGSPEFIGTLNLLKEIFGGELNTKGYFILPSYIRMIYGDAITPEITEKVCSWCVRNNISVSNLCFGIGAYTYQYVTRDTRGYAIKATDCILGNDEIQIYKMPKTDPGKKSPRGCVAIFKEENGDYSLVENLTLEESIGYKNNVMKFKVKNGSFCTESVETIETIKERLMGEVL
jgi:nicotinamide phosphoribosyltransferase|nr:MAG TPA: putative nicotinate phosphoribosyltransferase [Caudoviricetes sp.]